MCRRYGERGKYWSNYVKLCLDHKSLVFHPSTGVYDADKQSQIDRLSREVEKLIATKYHLDASKKMIFKMNIVQLCLLSAGMSTTSSDATPIQRATVGLVSSCNALFHCSFSQAVLIRLSCCLFGCG